MRRYPLMIFAAGFGTRMKHLTSDRPKPMIQVAGQPLIDHALKLGTEAGCDPIVANLHYLPDVLKQHLADTPVQTIVEMPNILETGGGLRNALPLLGTETVCTMNPDAVWAGPNPIKLLTEAWNPSKMDALLMTVPLVNALGYGGAGDFTISKEGTLIRGPGVIYGGVQIIKTEGLFDVEETAFSLNLLWDRMLGENRLFGLRYPGQWCDVGHPEGIRLAEKMIGAQDV